jgi:Family of unknown function (DUF5675)
MKVVVLQRAWSDERATIGMLTILDEKHDPFFTLENPKRATSKDSLIPAGEYECEPFSGEKYKNVYQVKNVPGRSAILFHWGNTERETKGCILVGNEAGLIWRDPAVKDSKNAFARFAQIIGDNPFCLIIEDSATA